MQVSKVHTHKYIQTVRVQSVHFIGPGLTKGLLFKLLYFTVSQFGGGRRGGQPLKGARPKMGRRFYWAEKCREVAGGLSEVV